MSTWRCKVDDTELGPMPFQELADLVREGNVTEKALVCREGTMKWEPAWHVPGLLRAAGIIEPGDSPAAQGSGFRGQGPDIETSVANQTALTPTRSRRERGILLVRGTIAAVAGLLAVGFFYRWAHQAMMAFPMRPTTVDGELIDCYFPLVGRCTGLECGLLYIDVFAVAALATWCAVGDRVGGRQ